MLKANGLKDVTSIKLGEKLKESTHSVQQATVSFDSAREPLEVMIKFNKGDSPNAAISSVWREAYFYGKIVPEYLKSLKVPKVYIAMID